MTRHVDGHNREREAMAFMAMVAEAAGEREAEIMRDLKAGRVRLESAEASIASLRRADFPGRIAKLAEKRTPPKPRTEPPALRAARLSRSA
jgi:hypothetical protein